MAYIPSQQVNRIEDREQVAAVVLATEDSPYGQILLLEYVEGGTGWWPAYCVEAADGSDEPLAQAAAGASVPEGLPWGEEAAP